ncbi:serine/threonine protein kinase, partial [Vibrio parahaemolyticus]|uniref:serine/threonine protein kinase n=1 Tax=Vibrio parahaemolyticus TaxID=670 RepID=UPI001A8FED57
HPNVVDVTDFGVAEISQGRVAYLVMEYLDGCTLGEILDEVKNLPLNWTIDILEQVCSAVHAAHQQGIIHRDLKPDNIWL